MARSAADRARRLMALLPMLSMGQELPLAQAAAALDSTPQELAADIGTLSLCGVPPYTPYELVSVFVDGDAVVMYAEPPALDTPVRLSADEAQALGTALETAGRHADDPLVASLLSHAGPAESDEALTARVVGRSAGMLGVAARAAEAGETLRIRYLTGASGVIGDRIIRPWAISEHGGAWYLTAFCETADAERVFRIDRIAEAEPTGATFQPPEEPPVYAPDVFDASALPTATVAFDPGQEVDPRDWPGAEITTAPDGSTVAVVPMGDPRWLARRVVARLGAARVTGPPAMQESVANVAKSLLKGLGD